MGKMDTGLGIISQLKTHAKILFSSDPKEINKLSGNAPQPTAAPTEQQEQNVAMAMNLLKGIEFSGKDGIPMVILDSDEESTEYLYGPVIMRVKEGHGKMDISIRKSEISVGDKVDYIEELLAELEEAFIAENYDKFAGLLMKMKNAISQLKVSEESEKSLDKEK